MVYDVNLKLGHRMQSVLCRGRKSSRSAVRSSRQRVVATHLADNVNPDVVRVSSPRGSSAPAENTRRERSGRLSLRSSTVWTCVVVVLLSGVSTYGSMSWTLASSSVNNILSGQERTERRLQEKRRTPWLADTPPHTLSTEPDSADRPLMKTCDAVEGSSFRGDTSDSSSKGVYKHIASGGLIQPTFSSPGGAYCVEKITADRRTSSVQPCECESMMRRHSLMEQSCAHIAPPAVATSVHPQGIILRSSSKKEKATSIQSPSPASRSDSPNSASGSISVVSSAAGSSTDVAATGVDGDTAATEVAKVSVNDSRGDKPRTTYPFASRRRSLPIRSASWSRRSAAVSRFFSNNTAGNQQMRPRKLRLPPSNRSPKASAVDKQPHWIPGHIERLQERSPFSAHGSIISVFKMPDALRLWQSATSGPVTYPETAKFAGKASRWRTDALHVLTPTDGAGTSSDTVSRAPSNLPEAQMGTTAALLSGNAYGATNPRTAPPSPAPEAGHAPARVLTGLFGRKKAEGSSQSRRTPEGALPHSPASSPPPDSPQSVSVAASEPAESQYTGRKDHKSANELPRKKLDKHCEASSDAEGRHKERVTSELPFQPPLDDSSALTHSMREHNLGTSKDAPRRHTRTDVVVGAAEKNRLHRQQGSVTGESSPQLPLYDSAALPRPEKEHDPRISRDAPRHHTYVNIDLPAGAAEDIRVGRHQGRMIDEHSSHASLNDSVALPRSETEISRRKSKDALRHHTRTEVVVGAAEKNKLERQQGRVMGESSPQLPPYDSATLPRPEKEHDPRISRDAPRYHTYVSIDLPAGAAEDIRVGRYQGRMIDEHLSRPPLNDSAASTRSERERNRRTSHDAPRHRVDSNTALVCGEAEDYGVNRYQGRVMPEHLHHPPMRDNVASTRWQEEHNRRVSHGAPHHHIHGNADLVVGESEDTRLDKYQQRVIAEHSAHHPTYDNVDLRSSEREHSRRPSKDAPRHHISSNSDVRFGPTDDTRLDRHQQEVTGKHSSHAPLYDSAALTRSGRERNRRTSSDAPRHRVHENDDLLDGDAEGYGVERYQGRVVPEHSHHPPMRDNVALTCSEQEQNRRTSHNVPRYHTHDSTDLVVGEPEHTRVDKYHQRLTGEHSSQAPLYDNAAPTRSGREHSRRTSHGALRQHIYDNSDVVVGVATDTRVDRYQERGMPEHSHHPPMCHSVALTRSEDEHNRRTSHAAPQYRIHDNGDLVVGASKNSRVDKCASTNDASYVNHLANNVEAETRAAYAPLYHTTGLMRSEEKHNRQTSKDAPPYHLHDNSGLLVGAAEDTRVDRFQERVMDGHSSHAPSYDTAALASSEKVHNRRTSHGAPLHHTHNNSDLVAGATENNRMNNGVSTTDGFHAREPSHNPENSRRNSVTGGNQSLSEASGCGPLLGQKASPQATALLEKGRSSASYERRRRPKQNERVVSLRRRSSPLENLSSAAAERSDARFVAERDFVDFSAYMQAMYREAYQVVKQYDAAQVVQSRSEKEALRLSEAYSIPPLFTTPRPRSLHLDSRGNTIYSGSDGRSAREKGGAQHARTLPDRLTGKSQSKTGLLRSVSSAHERLKRTVSEMLRRVPHSDICPACVPCRCQSRPSLLGADSSTSQQQDDTVGLNAFEQKSHEAGMSTKNKTTETDKATPGTYLSSENAPSPTCCSSRRESTVSSDSLASEPLVSVWGPRPTPMLFKVAPYKKSVKYDLSPEEKKLAIENHIQRMMRVEQWVVSLPEDVVLPSGEQDMKGDTWLKRMSAPPLLGTEADESGSSK